MLVVVVVLEEALEEVLVPGVEEELVLVLLAVVVLVLHLHSLQCFLFKLLFSKEGRRQDTHLTHVFIDLKGKVS